MSSSQKIQATKDYRKFIRSTENRPLDIKKHKRLMESMKLYGFLRCFPIVCRRDAAGQLVVKDGQHRLTIAEALGIMVYWIEEEVDFDVAMINTTSKIWVLSDYAQKFAANGHKAYQEAIEFAELHSLPMGMAVSLLAGTISFSNVQSAFLAGDFVVKDRPWADAVASLYRPLSMMSPAVKNARLIEACMAVCRVPDFDAKRLLAGAERCRDKLVNYSTRESYLEMMEEIYNFGRKQLVGLKAAATMAMRERNFATSTNGKAKKKEN